jgi:Bacterial PH domain
VLRFQTTAKASADAHALGQVGLARFDLIIDAVALVTAIVLLATGNTVLGAVVAVIAGLSLLGRRSHPLQRAIIAMRFRSFLGRTTEVTIADDGLHFANPLGTSIVPWSSITAVRSNSQTVAFFRDRVLLGYIPSSAFDSLAAQANVVHLAQTRIDRGRSDEG